MELTLNEELEMLYAYLHSLRHCRTPGDRFLQPGTRPTTVRSSST